jgi:hypothetical protein
VEDLPYARERLTLEDGDFLDLDWLIGGNNRLMIISHGLEGSSRRPYVQRHAAFFHERNWDILAWNCRGCSGEINRLKKSYHHGDIADYGRMMQEAFTRDYREIVLVGFSMGGNMQLKYLAMQGKSPDVRIKASVGYSVPCHLEHSARTLEWKENRIYLKRFLAKLREKLERKAQIFPELQFDWDQIRSFSDFNTAYTLPVYGFASEQEFYEQARTDILLEKIQVPSLIVNAANDPMLSGKNYPTEEAGRSAQVWLEVPRKGGHVGFTRSFRAYSWMEFRTAEFLHALG